MLVYIQVSNSQSYFKIKITAYLKSPLKHTSKPTKLMNTACTGNEKRVKHFVYNIELDIVAYIISDVEWSVNIDYTNAIYHIL